MTALIMLLMVIFLFASCSNEVIPDGIKNESISCAYDFGDVSRIFDKFGRVSATSGTPRFFNGQIVTIGGVELYFNAYLVEYNSIVKEIADYVEGIEANNALMHQSYPNVRFNPTKKYVEIASYYYAGTIIPAFREVRVFSGNFMDTFDSDYWYAKSVNFSPDFSIDLSKGKYVRTGKDVNYTYVTMWKDPAPILNHEENVVEKEDGYSILTYYDSGEIRRETSFSFDLKKQSIAYYLITGELAAKEIVDGKGHLQITQEYTDGILASELFYDEEEYCFKSVEYDTITRTVSSVTEYTTIKDQLRSVRKTNTTFNSDGFKTGEIGYYLSGLKEYELVYDGTEECNCISETRWDEDGKIIS